MSRMLLNITIPLNWMQNSSHTPVWATVWWNIDDYLMLVIIYLKHQSLKIVNSLKITHLSESVILLCCYLLTRNFPHFLTLTAPVPKVIQVCVKQQNYMEEIVIMKVQLLLMYYRLLKTNSKVYMLSTFSLYTACAERILPFLFTW